MRVYTGVVVTQVEKIINQVQTNAISQQVFWRGVLNNKTSSTILKSELSSGFDDDDERLLAILRGWTTLNQFPLYRHEHEFLFETYDRRAYEKKLLKFEQLLNTISILYFLRRSI